jgi:hypothetical protein
VLFDRVRLYDPFHLENFQGVFSTLDPRVVRSMEVYTGGFAAKHGDRMSGVVDVTSVPAPERRYHEIALSFFNASALSAGRFMRGDRPGEWVVSARRSNLDALYGAFSDRPERPRYSDAFAKVSYAVNDRLEITGSALYFRDDVELNDDLDIEERAVARDEDRYTWLRLDHRGDGVLEGTTLLSRARLATDRRGVSTKEGVDVGTLEDRRRFSIDSLESDWTWSASDSVRVEFGAAVSRLRGEYDYRDAAEFALLFAVPGAPPDTERERSVAVTAEGSRQALYGSLRLTPTDRLAVDLGLRADRQTLASDHGATSAPRLGLRYSLAPGTDVKVSLGRFYQSQAVTELAVADGERDFLPPQRADQAVVALEHELRGGARLRVEVYRKELADLHPRYENLLHPLTLLPEIKPDRVRLAPDAALARGLELSIAGGDEGVRWSAAYTWAEVEDLFGADSVPRSWDQTHAFAAVLDWRMRAWSFTAAAVHRTGWPTTAVALANEAGEPLVAVGPRNALRFARYRTVDLRATRIVELAAARLAFHVEVGNVFDRANQCCTEYEIDETDEGPRLELTGVDYLPRILSLGFVVSF